MSKENDPGLFCFSKESLMVGKEKKSHILYTKLCYHILDFSKEFISYKIVHISEKSINKNTRGNFSQDCRIQSYTLHL